MAEDSDFIVSLGRPFTSHRLRRLSEHFVDAYEQWLPGFGVTVPARSLSTLLLLSREDGFGVTELAGLLRLSHPLLIRMVGVLERDGLVTIGEDERDARRRPIALTAQGRAEVSRVKSALRVIDHAYAQLFDDLEFDLIAIVSRVEDACVQESFRVRIERAAEKLSKGRKAKCVGSC